MALIDRKFMIGVITNLLILFLFILSYLDIINNTISFILMALIFIVFGIVIDEK